MKSLFSRFKPVAPGPSSRASLDSAGGSSGGDPLDDNTVKFGRSRSFRRPGLPERTATSSSSASQKPSYTPSSTSLSSSKDLPARPNTPGPSASASSEAPKPPPKDADTALRPPRVALDIPDLGDWEDGAGEGAGRLSADHVKKVAFRSPQRPAAVPGSADADGRARTVSGEREAEDPDDARSPTPTRDHHRSHSRASSHTSMRGMAARRVSTSASVAASSPSLSQSPSKSTFSNFAPSEASTASAQSYIPLPESWSAAMDDELIANLGPRERARQEVLWEIVNSEERYVQDLIKLKDTFCTSLLPEREAESIGLPDPLALPDPLGLGLGRTASPVSSSSHEQHDFLPIAAQYAAAPGAGSVAPTLRRQSVESTRDEAETAAARMNALAALTRGSSNTPAQQPPAVERQGSTRRGIASHFKRSSKGEGHARVSSRSSLSSIAPGPITLPDDLEQVLAVISTGILEGHLKLVSALRKRYDEQFPLVRSLADVFTSHSDILREYATYILHLERALAQIDEAALMAETIERGGRRSSRRLEETQLGRLAKTLQGLEEVAAQRGEAGLAISLSKPFQRLLKYPLLFQNLLFNTSPSTREYEATLAMVDEVQTIVRSIEDEKSSSEERERARDAWARIEGMERNKQLMAPKPTRLLVAETSLQPKDKAKPKSSHRLSEILKHKNTEHWIVQFSDVSLLCERTGSTSLPMSTKGRSESSGDLNKRLSSSKRHHSVKARNLYRFIKVYEWHERTSKPETPPPRVSLDYRRTSLDAMRRAGMDHYRRPSLDHHPTLDKLTETTPRKASATGSAVTPRKVPMKTTDGSPNKLTPRRRAGSPTKTDDGGSDVMSVMSFAFRSETRPVGPAARRSLPPGRSHAPGQQRRPSNPERRHSGSMPNAAATAKFAHRLRSSDELTNIAPTAHPSSRVRRSLPPAMALPERSVSGGRASGASSARPPWNASMRPVSVREEHETDMVANKRDSTLSGRTSRARPPSVVPRAKSKDGPAIASMPPRPASAAARSSGSEREPLADAANQKDKVPRAGSAAGSRKGDKVREEIALGKDKSAPVAAAVSRTNVEVVVGDKPTAPATAAAPPLATATMVKPKPAGGGVAARIAALERRNLGGHI